MRRRALAGIVVAMISGPALAQPVHAPATVPADPRPAVDRAADVLAELTRDGSDSEVLFGLPLPDQPRRVADAARRALEMLDAARRDLESLLDLAERSPDRIAVVQSGTIERAELDFELGTSLPLLFGRARILLAAAIDDAEESARLIDQARTGLDAIEVSDRFGEASRLVALGWALNRSGVAENSGRARRAFARGIALLREPSDRSHPAYAEAWFGLVASAGSGEQLDQVLGALAQARTAPPFVVDGRADPLLQMLASDAITRSLLDRTPTNQALLTRAVAEQARLASRTDLGLERSDLLSLALARLGPRIDASAPLDRLPPIATLARAVHLAARQPDVPKALDLLDGLARRPDAGPLAAEALWEAAAILLDSDEPARRLGGVQRLIQLAADRPDWPRSEMALIAAVQHAEQLATLPDAPGGADEAWASALRLAIERLADDSRADVWRVDLGALELEAGHALDAMDAVEAIGRDSPMGERARSVYTPAIVSALESAWDQFRSARLTSADRARALARERLVPLAQRGLDWTHDHGGDSEGGLADRLRLDLGLAQVEAEQPAEALATLESLRPQAIDEADQIRLDLAMGRAQLGTGHTREGFARLRGLGDRLEGVDPLPEAFWQAWTIMLETLGADNTDGRRTPTIVAHLARLRSLDPELGGPPWKTRLERLKP